MEPTAEAWIDAIRQRLRDARLALGLSFNVAAERTGVTFSSIQRMEAGRVAPSLQIAHRLARGYGLSLEELFAEAPKWSNRKKK